MTDLSFTTYVACVELIEEAYAKGEAPHPDLLALIERARMIHPEWMPPGITIPLPPLPPAPVQPRAVIIENNERKIVTVTDDIQKVVCAVLEHWGMCFRIFQSGGRLVEIQIDAGKDIPFLIREQDGPRAVVIGAVRARTLAARECLFQIEKKQSMVEMLPPEWLGGALVSCIDFQNIPVLGGLAQAPTLRRDGALVYEPGYDASTGLYLVTDIQVQIPDNPTLQDAEASLRILSDLLVDFDFTNPAGKSVWLAALLSVACRHTYTGPTPLFIIDASMRGSGKTLLADMVSYIATGHSAPRMVYAREDVEMDKRIAALGIAGEQLVLIDNIVGKLASPSLDAALTSHSYRARVLGKTEMTGSIPMKIVWLATGNGMLIGADTARRALLARLEPPVDRPENRKGPRPGTRWRYSLPDYCQQRRSALLGHALTIVAAYIRAGRPRVDLGQSEILEMGSFKDWGDTIRSAIVWAGGTDPCATIQDAQEADLENLALRRMLDCWPVAEGVEITAKKLLEWAENTPPMNADASKQINFEKTREIREIWREALLNWLPARSGFLPTARELGYALRTVNGTIIKNYKIEAGKHSLEGIPWKKKQI